MSKFIRLNIVHYGPDQKSDLIREQLINVDSILRVNWYNKKRSEIVTTEIDPKYRDSVFRFNHTRYTIDMPYEELSQYIINATSK